MREQGIFWLSEIDLGMDPEDIRDIVRLLHDPVVPGELVVKESRRPFRSAYSSVTSCIVFRYNPDAEGNLIFLCIPPDLHVHGYIYPTREARL